MNYDWNFSRIVPYWEAFLGGIGITILLTALVIVLGTILGAILGLLQSNRVWRVFVQPLVDIVRSLPLLVLLFFLYYTLTAQVIGVVVPVFWVACIALSLNLAAFTSELVRATIERMPKTSIDSAKALGMDDRQITLYIVVPYVVHAAIPGMAILYIGMLKLSSLASIINVHEITYTANTVTAHVARSLEAWVIVGLIYLVLVMPFTLLERKLGSSLRPT